MIDRTTLTSLKAANVKLGLDIVLCLRPYSPLDGQLESLVVLHPVRTLGILQCARSAEGALRFHIDDPVWKALEDWRRSSRDDFNKIMTRLATTATNDDVHNPNILKPVRHEDGRGLFEIVGKRGHARVFVFYDPPSRYVVVGSGTYWKQGRSLQKEREAQDAAILKAANRKKQWIEAQSIENLDGWRVQRTRSS